MTEKPETVRSHKGVVLRSLKKSSQHSRCIRQVIADPSPRRSQEMGLLVGSPEKNSVSAPEAATTVHSLQSRSERHVTKNGHNLRISARTKPEFLRSPDWVAERAGFEPPVQVFIQEKLQTLKDQSLLKPCPFASRRSLQD